jgi:hypothetical protein
LLSSHEPGLANSPVPGLKITDTGQGAMTQSGLQPPTIRLVTAGPKAQADAKAQPAADPHRTVGQIAKDIGLFAAAPFVTLAYVSLFPFIAMAMLVRTWHHRKEPG